MKYREARVRPLAELVDDLSSGNSKRMSFALVDLMASVDNYEYLRDTVSSYLRHESAEFASLAIHCLGDLARLYPEDAVHDEAQWRTLLLELYRHRKEVRGAVEDALDDFDVFLSASVEN